jgi:flagellar biosynthetic protein FliQ
MPIDTVLLLAKQALQTALWICGPALIAGLAVGLITSIFQVATSIQDPNLSTLPRIGVMVLVLFILLPGILQTMTSYTIQLFQSIPHLVR